MHYTGNGLSSNKRLEDPPSELGVSESLECDLFPLQCFDTVGWVTGRASGV